MGGGDVRGLGQPPGEEVGRRQFFEGISAEWGSVKEGMRVYGKASVG